MRKGECRLQSPGMGEGGRGTCKREAPLQIGGARGRLPWVPRYLLTAREFPAKGCGRNSRRQRWPGLEDRIDEAPGKRDEEGQKCAEGLQVEGVGEVGDGEVQKLRCRLGFLRQSRPAVWWLFVGCLQPSPRTGPDGNFFTLQPICRGAGGAGQPKQSDCGAFSRLMVGAWS